MTIEDLKARMKPYEARRDFSHNLAAVTVTTDELQEIWRNSSLAQWIEDRKDVSVLGDEHAALLLFGALVVLTEEPYLGVAKHLALASLVSRGL